MKTTELIITDDSIKLSTDNERSAVMHISEKKLMEKLAEITTKNGGDILEIGFGMNLSADFIQSNPNVTSHTIIEIHPVQYQRALVWASKQKKKTKVLLGDWIDLLPLNNLKFDGILHDTHLDSNIPKLLDYIKNNCKKNTIVSFFDYPKFDTRMNAVIFKMNESDYSKLPYKNNIKFKNGEYELKYTTFNGVHFESNKLNIKSII